MQTTTQIYELTTNYDARQSFYGKAQVLIEGNRKILRSYNTNVAIIEEIFKDDLGRLYSTGEYNVEVFGTYSPTTLRHIKEFLKQNGFKAENKKQIIKDYLSK